MRDFAIGVFLIVSLAMVAFAALFIVFDMDYKNKQAALCENQSELFPEYEFQINDGDDCMVYATWGEWIPVEDIRYIRIYDNR